MDFKVFADPLSLSFIRCIGRIPGSAFYAEGTGFTVQSAVDKCRSEVIERSFQIRIHLSPLGIAAHPDKTASEKHAFYEAIETLVLEGISESKKFQGIPLFLSKDMKLYCTKVNGLWFSLLAGKHAGRLTYSYSARPNLFRSILQSWCEYRNLTFYKLRTS